MFLFYSVSFRQEHSRKADDKENAHYVYKNRVVKPLNFFVVPHTHARKKNKKQNKTKKKVILKLKKYLFGSV